ncbi:DUF1453 domain-containing protein [Streptomyces sp. NPDC052396]|uniref:DUF1453 domain-containing protein n=1 Tax=Streptomyces sp. NPDC052396 TaxID=3365689 RepID=UPI0037D70389
MNALLVALVVLVVVAVIVKRLKGEPLNLRDLAVPPVVLTVIGGTALAKAHGLTAADLGWTAAGALLAVALGALRGTTVRIFARDGVLWQRYTGRTFLVLLVSLLLGAGYGLLAERLGMHRAARPAQLSIGLGFLGEALVLGCRGLRSGLPFAPERVRRRG